MQMIHREIKVMPKEVGKVVNVIGAIEKEEMFNNDVDAEPCWIILLK